MAKSKQRRKARLLRKQGQSLKEIARQLFVSPGSVSSWCNDIVLTNQQIKQLEIRMKDPTYGRRDLYLRKVKEERLDRIKILFEEGFNEIGTLSPREIFIAGTALYWAEGFKKDKQIGFANIDPKMINFFILWLIRCFNVGMSRIKARVTLNQSYITKIPQIERFWADTTNIPLSNFQKPIIQKVQWKKEYENKNDYKGVLRIRVSKSLPILRKIFGYIEGLSRQSLITG